MAFDGGGVKLNETRCISIAVSVVLAAMICLVGLVCPAQAQTEQSIVVLVNDDPITLYDIEQRQRFLAVTTQEQPSPALKKKATDMLIDERLQLQQGKKLGITPDEEEVQKVLVGMAQNNQMTPEQLGAALGQMGVNMTTLKDRIRSQVVWKDVVRRKFRHDVSVGDAEVDKALTDAGESAKPQEETTLELREIKYEIPTEADQAAIARQLAAVEAVRAKLQSCSNVSTLTKDIKGFKVKTLDDQLPDQLGQPMRTLVMNAKVGQMTPPTLTGSAIEAYAVCGKHAVKGDPKKRQETQSKLMEQEYGLRAEGLLRDMRQNAFIEYRHQQN
jgi:peptidyl-prolyl cis-trans isomerase SurA